MAQWGDKITIRRDDGSMAEAHAPVIVSASRSTDIPAFYCDWFFYRLKKGYSAWTNPFNGVKSFISYEKTRFIVFWSKNPRPLLNHIHELADRGIKCYVQYTLNDYENEKLEKNVPSLSERIETFHMLKEKLGLGGVVWRFDPLILTNTIDVDSLLRKIENIGNQLKGATEKLVFSYADILEYRKVKANLEKDFISYRLWDIPQMEKLAEELCELNKKWGYILATCGEKIDLSKFGIEHNRCVDADLIVRRAFEDKVLMDYMKIKIEKIGLFGISEDAIALPGGQYFHSRHKKDQGQREFCGCMASKDVGEYNTCPHMCEYCYANTSKEIALANWRSASANKTSETITGK